MSKKIFFGDEFIFTSRNSTGTIIISAGAGESLSVNTENPKGGFGVVSASQTITIASQSVFVDLDVPTIAYSENTDFTHSDGTLTYTGGYSRSFMISYYILYSGTSGDVITTGTSIDGALPLLESQIGQPAPAGNLAIIQEQSIFKTLSTGDVVSFKIANTTAARDVVLKRFNVTIVTV
jgi:hypothetical protein